MDSFIMKSGSAAGEGKQGGGGGCPSGKTGLQKGCRHRRNLEAAWETPSRLVPAPQEGACEGIPSLGASPWGRGGRRRRAEPAEAHGGARGAGSEWQQVSKSDPLVRAGAPGHCSAPAGNISPRGLLVGNTKASLHSSRESAG